jgi:UDP-N-acetylmuramate dehydrogenase
MKIEQNPSLGALNSFGVEAGASALLTIESEEDVLELPALDPERDILLGGGSNVLLVTDIPGSVYLNRIGGRAVVDDGPDSAVIEVGAGENWHDLVRWSLENGLSGLENLSLIPGLAGAAPIQNIGAYGVELSSVLERVTAWDWRRSAWTSFDRQECQLGYRDSRFKGPDKERYLITSISLRLNRRFDARLDYAGIREELEAAGIRQPTALDVSDAVIRLRRRKLPDPREIGNAGSFFKNPAVSADFADKLQGQLAAVPQWGGHSGSVKLSAAWLIEHCGLKGFRAGDAGISEKHALVLVNYGSASGRDIAELARNVQKRVLEETGIALEPEPRLIEFNS